MRMFRMMLLSGVALHGLLAPLLAHATDCSAPVQQPLRPTVLAPVAAEFGSAEGNRIGAANGVLSQLADESQSVDQVLLRIRVESCQNIASLIPVPGTVSPDNPAAYKPRTQYDNTPWRFNMSQNGKKMTADEFSAWMQARGVRVARGAGAAAPALPAQQDVPAGAPPAQNVPTPAAPTPTSLPQVPQPQPVLPPPPPPKP